MICRLWVWCVLFALPVYGLSGVLLQMLGPAHFHKAGMLAVASADNQGPAVSLVDFRREDVRSTTLTADELHELSHRQHPFTRHYHAADDATVVMLDEPADPGASDAPGPSTAGSACLTLGLVDPFAIGEPGCVAHAWRRAPDAAVRTTLLLPPEQPPKT